MDYFNLYLELTPVQEIILGFIILEFVVVTLIVIGTYLAKLYFVLKGDINESRAKEVREYFKNRNFSSPPPHYKHPHLIITELNKSSLKESDKKEIITKHLLEIARPYVNSSNWLHRYFLLECYKVVIEPEDKENIIILINDDVDIVNLNAMNLYYFFDDEEVCQVVFDKLNKLSYAGQEIHIPQLPKCNAFYNVLKKNLVKSSDLKQKYLCYNLLKHLGTPAEFYDLALADLKDIESITDFATLGDDYMNCSLAAIEVMAYADPDKAKKLLLKLLKHKNWLVRNKVIHALGKLMLPGTAKEIAQHLADPEYWVRVNASKELLNFGDEGHNVLAQYVKSESAEHHDDVKYFLDIYKFKQ